MCSLQFMLPQKMLWIAECVSAIDLVGPTCARESSETVLVNPSFISDETSIAEMSSFCYLGDIIGGEGRAERAVRMRIAAAWSKWRERRISCDIDGFLLKIQLSCIIPVYELRFSMHPRHGHSPRTVKTVSGAVTEE